MVKNQSKWIFFIVIALIVAGMFLQNRYELFAVLPEGQTYEDAACTFISNTNIVQASNQVESISDFASTYTKWIAVDWNGDGIKEGYGYAGSVSQNQGDTCSGKTQITTTPGGIKVVKWAVSNEIAVCQGLQAYVYKTTSSYASSAILTCQNQPQNPVVLGNLDHSIEDRERMALKIHWTGGSSPYHTNWTLNGATQTSTVIVPPNALEDGFSIDLSPTGHYTGRVCVNNVCKNIDFTEQLPSCNTEADTDCNQIVSFSELTTYAGLWINNQKTFAQLLIVAGAWTNG